MKDDESERDSAPVLCCIAIAAVTLAALLITLIISICI